MAESDTATEVLTRAKGLKEQLLPTGRKLGVVPVRGLSMYQLAYSDGKGGEIPDEYKSKFTSYAYAQRELNRFLVDFWDVSDRAQSKKKTITLNHTNAVG
jgi:hypothetical protein